MRSPLVRSLLAAAVAGLVALISLFTISGGSWFVVDSPSMGVAAPVGTVLFDRPVRGPLHLGEIITYRSPANASVTYTHRVIRIDRDGSVQTKGDINGAIDPWTINRAEILGTPVLIVPWIGWFFRAVPILVLGLVVVAVATSFIRDRVARGTAWVLGVTCAIAVAGVVLQPFVAVDVLATTASATSVHATVVSTGILPTEVRVLGGDSVVLNDGQVGHLAVAVLHGSGKYQLESSVHMGPLGTLMLTVVCAIPLVWCLALGRAKEGIVS